MLKAQCGDCAYKVRVARKWIAEYGAPLCPCNNRPMESDYAAELEDQARDSMVELEVDPGQVQRLARKNNRF